MEKLVQQGAMLAASLLSRSLSLATSPHNEVVGWFGGIQLEKLALQPPRASFVSPPPRPRRRRCCGASPGFGFVP